MNRRQQLITLILVATLALLGIAAWTWQSWWPVVNGFLEKYGSRFEGLEALVAIGIALLTWLGWLIGKWISFRSESSQRTDRHTTEAALDTLHRIPPPPQEFTGRVTELNKLLDRRGWRSLVRGLWSRALRRHRSDAPRLIGLMGMGGIGKTTLALKVAQHLRDDFPDAHLFLDMRGTREQPRTPAETMTEVIRAFHPKAELPEEQAALRSLYLGALRDKRVLLLLDDAKDREQVEPLLPPASCALLVTSRLYFALPNLQPLRLDTLPPADARELLRKIASSISEVEAKQLTELCGYLPLAITLAGSAIVSHPDLTPTEYARLLQDERRLDLVEASLTLSYNLLDETLQQHWRMLAVFPATFDRYAGAAVWGMNLKTELDAAAETLSTLVRYSLVEWLETERRYRLHDLARLFASARLADDERHTVQRRHAAHFLTVLDAADTLYLQGGAGVLQGLALFDAEWLNIQAGQAWAALHAARDDTAARLCSRYPDAGAYVLTLRQHSREQIEWLQLALAAAHQLGDRHAEGNRLGNLGNAYLQLGEVQQAIDCYQQQLTIAREIRDRGGEGAALGNLGVVYANLGEVRQAIDYYQQRLEIAREVRDRRGEGNVLGNLGNAYFQLGELRQAIHYYQQHLEITHEIGDRGGEGTTLGNLGNAYRNLGEVQQAIDCYQQQLTIAREIRDRGGEGYALGNLGNAYLQLGELRQAIHYYQQVLTIAHEISERRIEGYALGNLGNAYLQLGELRQAIDYFGQHLEIARKIGDRRGEGAALGNLGNAYLQLGELRQAIDYFGQHLEIARKIGDRRGEGNALFNMSLALDVLGERQQAIPLAEAALHIYEQIEDPYAETVRRQLSTWRGEEPPP